MDDKTELLNHLIADHGWTELDATANVHCEYEDLLEEHDQEHANATWDQENRSR